jgi:hypothetical protein
MNFNSNSITIKVDSVRDQASSSSQSTSEYNKTATERKAKALELLVAGNYNQYGRHIDTEKYEDLKARYENLLWEMEQLV